MPNYDPNNPSRVGLGGESGAPRVNDAPTQPKATANRTAPAPTQAVPIDPGDQQAQAPATDVPPQSILSGSEFMASVEGQPEAQEMQVQQEEQDALDGGEVHEVQLMAAPAPAGGDDGEGRTLAPSQPTAQEQHQGVAPPPGVVGHRGSTSQPEQAAVSPGSQGNGAVPLLRLLALKLIVENGGQLPDLDALEPAVQHTIAHVGGHAGRLGLLGTGARPPEAETPKTMSTLLAYGVAATMREGVRVTDHEATVEELLRWAYGRR